MPFGNGTRKTLLEIHKITNISLISGEYPAVSGEVYPIGYSIDEKGNVTESGRFIPEDCYVSIPRELSARLLLFKTFGTFGISNCSADTRNRILILTVFHDNDPYAFQEIMAQKINGWSVFVVSDTDLEQSMLRTHEHLHTLKKDHPELQILSYDLVVDSRSRPVQKIAEVFVTELTPENRALDGTDINGWKVRVLGLYEAGEVTIITHSMIPKIQDREYLE